MTDIVETNTGLPSDLDAERAVLGAILVDYKQSSPYIPRIRKDFFHSKSHRIIFESILSLHDAGANVDVVVLLDEIKKNHGKIEDVGGAYYLTGLVEATPSAANIKQYIDILSEKNSLRKHIILAEEIKQKVLKLEDSSTIADHVINSVLNSDEESDRPSKIIVKGDIERKRKEGLIGRLSGELVGSGYATLDRFLAQGFSPRTTSVIFGRTRHGKSALKSNLSVNQCKRGISVAHITPEQGFDIEMDRMTSILSGIPLIELLKIKEWAELKDNQIISSCREKLARIKDATSEINKWNIFFHSGTVCLAEAKRFILEVKRRYGVEIVYIDLFDRIEEVAREIAHKPQVVTKCISFFESIAVEQNIHICYLVQSSRGQESKVDKRPSLIDLKESGSYEERTWLILSVFREHLLKKEVPDDTIEISIAKQKNGPESTIELLWNPETLLISEDF